MITEEHRAGHALRVTAPKLVEDIVAEQYRLQPDLSERYGAAGRRYCVRDVGYHLQFLATSVELGDPRRFVDYVAWSRGVLAAHGVPASDLLVTLRAMRLVLASRLPPAAAEHACRHVDVALAACQP
jgi:hypothetical protein